MIVCENSAHHIVEQTRLAGAIYRTLHNAAGQSHSLTIATTRYDDVNPTPFLSNGLFPIGTGWGGPAGISPGSPEFNAGCAVYNNVSNIEIRNAGSSGFAPTNGNVSAPCGGNCYCPTPALTKRTATAACRESGPTVQILVSRGMLGNHAR
jgi:hypothetical protein